MFLGLKEKTRFLCELQVDGFSYVAGWLDSLASNFGDEIV